MNPNNPNDIQYFSQREHVRRRPGMYMGGTHKRALHNLAYEVIDDAVEEALAGHCNQIWISLGSNHQISIKDNGRGIPLDKTPDGKPLLEMLMTSSGVDRRQGDYYIRGGFFGILLYAVNALSAELVVEVARDGDLWRQTYREGIPQSTVEQVCKLEAEETTGKTITLIPDFSILEHNEFSYETLAERSQEIAYRASGLTITLRDNRLEPAREEIYCFPNGLLDLIRDLTHGQTLQIEPIFATAERTINERTISVHFAFQYSDSTVTTELSFANTVKTVGGTHLNALRSALRDVINNYAVIRGEPRFLPQEITPGLTAAVSIHHPNPSFESQTSLKLLNPEVYDVVAGIVYEKTIEFLNQNTDICERIIQKCLANRLARRAKFSAGRQE